jgi:deoxyribodipyrimidine photo-lyase
MKPAALHWFRDDLRLADNPALAAAVAHGPTLCLYILDEGGDRRPLGGAASWWLSRSLAALAKAVSAKGGELILMRGRPEDILPRLVSDGQVDLVTWGRRYEAPSMALDKSLKAELAESGVRVESFNTLLLNEPWQVTSKRGEPMKVFTPYWRAARALGDPAPPKPAPVHIRKLGLPASAVSLAVSHAELGLEPHGPDWAGGFRDEWTPGEAGAIERFGDFLDDHMRGYAEGRDRPDFLSTSRLSPHLRFGEIGPRQIWQAMRAALDAGQAAGSVTDADKFLSEIGWREFSYHLLFYNPALATQNYNQRFDAFPWRSDPPALRAWQRGLTGYPIVDAGLRELWTTGWMHNRVRMIVASFLIKHLLIDWREGEAWFWDTLVDADPANNSASWQWVAGSGADASPYYRIFNPVTQGRKFDPRGHYVRRWIPEIEALSDDSIHDPASCAAAELSAAGIKLGTTYPQPLIRLDRGRERALAALSSLKAD